MDEESSPKGYSNATSEARPAPSASSGRFQCPECTQTFGRVEHLTRHSRSHTNERFLKCTFCRKGFYRIDALRRHEQVHNQPKRSALGKRARACLACAAARRKCSGGEPCAPCEKRTIECKYPDVTRTRKATASEAPGLDSTVSQNEDISVQSGEEPIMLHAQDSPMSWSNRSESPRMNSGHPQKLAAGANSRISNSSHHSHGYDPGIYVSPFSQQRMPVQTPISPGLHGQELDQHTGQPSMHSDRHTRIGSSHLSTPIQDPLSSINSQTMESNLNLNDDQIPEAWFQNNFSSINWLPENWTPGYQIDAMDGISSFDQDQAMMFEQPLQRNPSSYAANSENLFLAAPVSPRISRTREQSRMTPLQHLVDGHEISSPSSQSTHSGRFYVDGDGARLPRVRKPPYRHSDARASAFLHESRDANPDFIFPDLNEYPDEPNVSLSSISSIPAAVYGEILRIYNLTCTNSSHYSNFQGGPFPSLQMFNRLVQLYGSNFRAILPFIHPASFDVSSTHWLLTLALATVGSHYVEDGSGQLVVAMSEFLRRVVQTVVDNGTANRPDSLTLTQVKILCCVGMMYCGDKRLMTIAKSYHSDLTSFCDTEWARLSVETQSSPASNDSEHFTLDWAIWIRAESGRRTGYCIWLLDSMWAFHFQMRPLLSLQDAKILIPCQEVLWEAESELDWGQLYTCATPSPSLHAAIQLAYIEKRLQSSMGEFSRILCIHALIRRTWEVETYFSNPLALWTPTAEKGSIAALSSSSGSVWLPSIQTYAKWRNSTCDCLDILHWHANSVIGAASGMEHPTVLHLHLARVILLTPFRQIVQLAEIMTSQTNTTEPEAETQIRAHITRWVLEDQHKARLAMIHAGVLFWHVRRYSTDAFYEPSSVYISTLALWAYGTFAPHTTSPPPNPNPASDAPSPSSDTESLFPTSMQLDRPADDELVQLFVKRGASMKANITGVGNLCSVKGPVRVLTEGRNLLAGLKSWGISGVAIRTLSGLVDVCKAAQVQGVAGEGVSAGS